MANVGNASWTIPAAICCLLLTLFLIASTIVLALIPVYLGSKNTANINARQNRVIGAYGSNLANGRSLTLASGSQDANQLLQRAGLSSSVNIPARGFTDKTPMNGKKRQTLTGNPVCEQPITLTGDIFLADFDITYPSVCGSSDCQERYRSNVANDLRIDHEVFTVDMTFTNGETISVQLVFCAFYTAVTSEVTTNTTAVTPTNGSTTTITDCTSETANYAYMIDINNVLYRFSPVTLDLTEIGLLNCSSTRTYYYIALQRDGVLWALAPSGILYTYDINTAQCTQTTFAANQSDFDYFSMAFVKDDTGNDETLYISKQNDNGGVLGDINLDTLTVSIVGNFSNGLLADIAGTNDGRLFGYFHDTDIIIKQINPTNAQILSQYPLAGPFDASVWGFTFFPYTSKFLYFIGKNGSTIIYWFDPATNTTTQVKTVSPSLYDSAVSTCLGTTNLFTTSSTAVTPTNCITQTRNYVYMIDLHNILYRFSPVTLDLTQIGTLNCSATTVFYYFALQRTGVLWVLAENGLLYTYDINTAQCTQTNFVANQSDFDYFSMAFVKDDTGNDETLYIGKINDKGGILGEIDLATLTVSIVGNYSSGLIAEVSGSNDGRLFGAFYGADVILKQINKENAQILAQYPLGIPYDATFQGFTYFSYNSSFFYFYSRNNLTSLYWFDLTANTTSLIKTVSQLLYYAAPSTCLGT